MTDLKGMRILLTGATGGIGTAIARELAGDGCRLIITGRNEAAGKKLESELNGSVFLRSDLVLPGVIPGFIQNATDVFQGLDCLINCAGLVLSKKLEDTSEADWERIMNINARIPYFLCQSALAPLRKSKRPVIVNVGSVVSYKGYPRQSAYSASKHALLGFTKSLASEVRDEGIRIHAVLPGAVDTPMAASVRPDIDTSDLITPEEIAEAVKFLIAFRGRGVIDELRVHRAISQPWA